MKSEEESNELCITPTASYAVNSYGSDSYGDEEDSCESFNINNPQ